MDGRRNDRGGEDEEPEPRFFQRHIPERLSPEPFRSGRGGGSLRPAPNHEERRVCCRHTHKRMKKAMLAIGKVINRFNSLLETLTGYVLFLFMALLFFQVIMRFIFNHPIYGIDEAVTALMIWTMCLGWCTVYWDNGHAVLEFIMKRMPPWFRRIMFTITNVIVVVISYVYIPAAYTLFGMQVKMPAVGGLPFCKAYYYALPVLVMGCLMLIYSGYKTITYIITWDESICVPVEKEGGGLLD